MTKDQWKNRPYLNKYIVRYLDYNVVAFSEIESIGSLRYNYSNETTNISFNIRFKSGEEIAEVVTIRSKYRNSIQYGLFGKRFIKKVLVTGKYIFKMKEAKELNKRRKDIINSWKQYMRRAQGTNLGSY